MVIKNSEISTHDTPARLLRSLYALKMIDLNTSHSLIVNEWKGAKMNVWRGRKYAAYAAYAERRTSKVTQRLILLKAHVER